MVASIPTKGKGANLVTGIFLKTKELYIDSRPGKCSTEERYIDSIWPQLRKAEYAEEGEEGHDLFNKAEGSVESSSADTP